jgi:hypothetical protein
MTTSINGIALPIKTLNFVATNFLDSVQGVEHTMEFVFFTGNEPIDPDFSQLVGVFDQTTEQIVGDVSHNSGNVRLFFHVFDNITVDYSNSTAAVRVDLTTNPQQGGFAQGDTLTNVFSVIGSPFNDTIRGSDLILNQPAQGVFNDPGANSLFGGGGDDIIEGRGGPDLINGGSGSDTASYESSPAGVTVTVNNPADGAFLAAGGDAAGDRLVSIENLLGSAFDDHLTGSSNNNVLTGGPGSDVLDGQGGTDTADYSPETQQNIDHVEVHLGIKDAGSGAEFKVNLSKLVQVSTDTLVDIENVIGTSGGDTLVGNDLPNRLDGGAGNDLIDGNFGSDVLIGGPGIDTLSFASHDGATPPGEINTISLGLNLADGSAVRSENGFPLRQIAETDVLSGFENVTGSNRTETINGNELANALDGRGGDDTINGGGDNDVVNGGDGNDTLDGGLGNDTLIGGPENDTASFASHNGLTGETGAISLGLGIADGTATYSVSTSIGPLIVETDLLRGIENVIGSSLNETISGNEQNNILDGGLGNDTLIGGGRGRHREFLEP